MKTKFILLCLVVAICGCGKKTVHNTTFAGKDYSLKFPDTWEINEKGMMGMDLIGLSPLESDDDAFRENINVILENLPKTMTDEVYLELTLANMVKMFGVPSDQKFVPVTVGNENGYHLHYTLQVGQSEMDNDLYIVINKNSAYVITCSNANGKREAFKTTMESIVDTFVIK